MTTETRMALGVVASLVGREVIHSGNLLEMRRTRENATRSLGIAVESSQRATGRTTSESAARFS